MFLVFTLVLLIVAIGILVSVYSVFFPFMQNLGTVQQYHMAYYGAVSAVERAELSLRYRSPGFVWSWGFLWTTWYGPLSDYTPELSSWTYQWFIRNIDSRTSTIPSPGMGNTDPMLSDPADHSDDYNQLWYTYLETFLLWYDATTGAQSYYTWWTTYSFLSSAPITGIIRFPPKIQSRFWWVPAADLCSNALGADCDPDGDGVYDDIVVSRSMEWLYNGESFKIFPTINVFYYSGMQVDEYHDNAIRESIINEWGEINIGTNAYAFTPIDHGSAILFHNVISSEADAIKLNYFSTILSNTSSYTWLRLSFGATNLFRTMTGVIYPYLEYQFTFPQPIADRFYTIEWHGRVGEYDVQIILKKPTVQWTIGWDFTVIF